MTSAQPGQGAGAPAGRPVEGGPRGFAPREVQPGSLPTSRPFLFVARARDRQVCAGIHERSPQCGRSAHGSIEMAGDLGPPRRELCRVRAAALVDRCVNPFLHADRRIRLLSSTAFPPLVWISPTKAEIDRNGPLYWVSPSRAVRRGRRPCRGGARRHRSRNEEARDRSLRRSSALRTG